MNSIQQRCRPKHQVLVLKCYPRMNKGTVDVKPNSSELSYLLYYATSRRTKIHKVGSFLEKKTASDVWRQRIGNVQITLQILEALIEKNPKDLPLFAPNVVKILDLILRSNDITMVESSIPTFEAFCTHHDASTLLGDQFFLAQFEAIVRHYASLASTRLSPVKTQPSLPVAMRWRNSGLEAIRAVASSDALSSISGRQYDMMVPMILENLWTDNENFLDVLVHRAELEEKVDTERMLKRRTSVATVHTADTAGDTNPLALSGTAMDVDKLAEEDIGVLAMLCLKQVFITPNRSLIHHATTALLDFVKERIEQGETVVRTGSGNAKDSGWAVKICGLLLRWSPVQERYIILVTAMDTLARTPLSDASLDHHNALAAMIASMLRSDASLIGLSVMDVLLGFLQHIKKLVQMPGDPAATVAVAEGPLPGQPDLRSPTTLLAAETVMQTALKRKELLGRLQQCIGDLATHIYYADQIADMVSAILFRLRPARSNTMSSLPPAEKPDEAEPPPTSHHHPHSADSLFSLPVARTAALKSIKLVLLVANPRTAETSGQRLSRNRVSAQVWDGTQWLLRDQDGQVRKAYIDAVLTWLDRETTRADQLALDENAAPLNSSGRPSTSYRPATRSGQTPLAGGSAGGSTGMMARRAVSNSSNRENGLDGSSGSGNGSGSGKRRRAYFLPLLHLAIYDNALQFVDYEADIVLLHVLLNGLVDKLGVNAVRFGLPMIFQLQESIQDVETPQAKVRVGSLVHGYFWTLTDKFDFEDSIVGRAIRNEITRRRSKHFWIDGVHVPPPMVELVGTPGMPRPLPKMPLHEIESEALLPFDDRISLVECICTGYNELLSVSPPQSPGIGTGFHAGALGLSAAAVGTATTDAREEIPFSFREQMIADWSHDGVLLASQPSGSKSVSLSGSRSGTLGTNNNNNNNSNSVRHRLTVETSVGQAGGQHYLNGGGLSPSASHQNLRPASRSKNDNLAPMVTKLRKTSSRSGYTPSAGGSLSSRGDNRGDGAFVTSLDQLKLALSGTAPANLGSSHQPNDDGSSDSMVSYDMTASELSFNPAAVAAGVPARPQSQPLHEPDPFTPTSVKRSASNATRKGSIGGSIGDLHGPLTSNPLQFESDTANGGGGNEADETVPPVPPLPSPLIREQQAQQAQQAQAGGGIPPVRIASSETSQGSPAPKSPGLSTRRHLKSRGGESMLSGMFGNEAPSSSMDLQTLLKGIDSRAGEHSLGNLSRPPY